MKHNVTSSVKIVTVWWRKLTHVVLLPCPQFLHVSIDYKCEGIILLPNRKVSGPSGRSPAEIVGSNPTGGMDDCLLWVLCCQEEVSATNWSLVQRSPTDCGASLCVS